MKTRSILSILLTTAIAMAAVLPGRPAAAAVSFSVTDVTFVGDQYMTTVRDGDTVDRGFQEVRIHFNRVINTQSFTNAVTITDSKGQDAGWITDAQGSGSGAFLYTGKLVPAGETYTIQLKGGPGGMVDSYGDPLPADWSFTFHTKDTGFHPTNIQVFAAGMTTVQSGATIPRDTTELRFNWDRLVAADSVSAVTVTDSKGQDPGWFVSGGSGQVFFIYIRNGELPRNETYTIKVKGGPNGLRSEAGVTLPEDLTFTLRTGDESVRRTATMLTNWRRYGVVQSEIFKVKAAPGIMRITLRDWAPGASAKVLLQDPETRENLLVKSMHDGGTTMAEATIPRAGTYDLLVGPNQVGTVEVEAMDLELSGEVPAVRLPDMKPFETRNEPFVMTPGVINPSVVKSVKVMLKDQVFNANALNTDGTVDRVEIKPAELEDGLYALTAIAEGTGAGHIGVNARTFLVDRVSAFSDVPASHWARRYIEVMHHLDVVNGRDDGSFDPAKPVKRAEFAKMLALMLGLKPGAGQSLEFADVADGWAKPHIQALAERGLIVGEEVGGQRYFYPDRTITRAEAATIIGRALGIATSDVSGAQANFGDFDQVPSWAKPSVVILSELKWINGFPDGKYYPGNTLQRDQAARILANFVGM